MELIIARSYQDDDPEARSWNARVCFALFFSLLPLQILYNLNCIFTESAMAYLHFSRLATCITFSTKHRTLRRGGGQPSSGPMTN